MFSTAVGLRSVIICCSHRVAVWGPQTSMGKTNTLTGDDGHPIPASQAPGVDKHCLTANLGSTGMYAEMLSYTLQNPERGYHVFSTKCFTLQPSTHPVAVFLKGHSLEQQAATGDNSNQGQPGDTALIFSHARGRKLRYPAHWSQD